MNQELVREKKTAYSIALIVTLMGALFIALSPIYFGFIFSVIFIIPIYMAINGLKGRRKVGFLIAMGLIPLAVGVSILWIRYFLSISSNLAQEILKISEANEISQRLVTFVLYGGFISGVILLVLSIISFVILLRHRIIFKSRK
jgi:hypothetical protein